MTVTLDQQGQAAGQEVGPPTQTSGGVDAEFRSGVQSLTAADTDRRKMMNEWIEKLNLADPELAALVRHLVEAARRLGGDAHE